MKTAEEWAEETPAFIENIPHFIRKIQEDARDSAMDEASKNKPHHALLRILNYIDKLENAIAFYGHEENYIARVVETGMYSTKLANCPIQNDRGQKAREALGNKL